MMICSNTIQAVNWYGGLFGRGVHLDAISLNCSKTLEWVSISRILEWLWEFGRDKVVVTWKLRLLRKLKLQGLVNGSLSSIAEAPSGVTRWSIMPPRLLAILVNKLFLQMNGKVLLYADGMKSCCKAEVTLGVSSLRNSTSMLVGAWLCT